MGLFAKFKKNNTKPIKSYIKYNRMSVCMGDDVCNDIYKIEMPSDATLGDLMDVVEHGGFGNNWPITSGYEWDVYANIGKIARIAPQTEKITYYDDNNKDIQLASLNIQWLFAARKSDTIDPSRLEEIFRD